MGAGRGPAVRLASKNCSNAVVAGEPLPPEVVLRPVPNYADYRYAVVNDRRVIVEPRTRKVIQDHRLTTITRVCNPLRETCPKG
jgi:hypothetical protein